MTKIYHTSRIMPKSNLGRENTLPKFKMMSSTSSITYDSSLTEEPLENAITDVSTSALPYLRQDHYDRAQKEGEIKTIVLENDYLKATFYPEYGGRLASLWDKEKNKELLFDNPVFQPANLAIRNAWFSGGIEWNGPAFGHTFTTCSPVHFGVHEKNGTKILRIYDYDRYFNTSWQIDFHLEENSKQLWFQVTLRNLSEKEVPLFWWTNIAAPINEKIRFLTQQDNCINHLMTQEIVKYGFPVEKGKDISYATNEKGALSIFLVKDKDETPWFSYADEKGYGLFHLSTKNLPGKKLWYFGSGHGGKNWMNKLSLTGQGDYIEIQAGVTDTQVQTLPFPSKSTISWTECIGPLTCDDKIVHGDYDIAANHTEEKIQALGVIKNLESVHEMMSTWQDESVDEVIHDGLAWGKIFELNSKTKIPGLTFTEQMSAKEQPWFELVTNGTFSNETLSREPISWMVDNRWKTVLEDSIKDQQDTWLHSLYSGVISLENNEEAEAITCFEKSISLKNNFHALRCLAVISFYKKDFEKAENLYKQAWECSDENEDLYLEILDELMNHRRYDNMASYLQHCPEVLKGHEFVSIGKAISALIDHKYEEARSLLLRDYSYLREGSTVVTDLWFKSYLEEKSKALSRELTDEEKRAVVDENAPPQKIDFRMH